MSGSWFTAHKHSLGEARDPMRKILGPEAGARIKPIWGLDAEGEINGAWRDLGLPHLWCMIGKLLLFFERKKKYSILCRKLCVVPIPLDAHCAACVSHCL
jgi:hypothetical protein